jgi:hypothetical protein
MRVVEEGSPSMSGVRSTRRVVLTVSRVLEDRSCIRVDVVVYQLIGRVQDSIEKGRWEESAALHADS